MQKGVVQVQVGVWGLGEEGLRCLAEVYLGIGGL